MPVVSNIAWTDGTHVHVPYNIAAIEFPTNFALSATYNRCEMCGALGLSGQGVSEVLDMAWV